IASVLGVRKNVLKTEGNFNNHIGLPATLLRLNAEHEAAVVEMGMNHKGEISYLTGIAKPTMAVITNIGDAHIGNLGSRENIFRAKCEIFEGLKPGGKAFLNGDDVLLGKLKDMPEIAKDAELVYVGESADCDYRAADIKEHADSISFTIVRHDAAGAEKMLDVTVPLPGRHMIYPALTACALADEAGLTDEETAAGISEYVPTRMRMETHACPGNIIVYNDTYNANPQSVRAGLLTLAGAEGAGGIRLKRVAVLGDMLELGSEEQRLHEETGRFAASLPLDALITVGPAARYIAEACRQDNPGIKVLAYADKQSAMDALRPLITEDTAFLCKASRGMALEEIAAFIVSEAARYGS
ncbi:MAG: UDP-N-acetylmuramoyl-tripeptide--D-alanyl-D-alanine ligase, partial [Lachnospiraceae bacterium]|nr:UDP-N-acetylmuramoyl-tripeptide--D-alanyl-D-alanine ligase [Lachnospiraceae bacterium]